MYCPVRFKSKHQTICLMKANTISNIMNNIIEQINSSLVNSDTPENGIALDLHGQVISDYDFNPIDTSKKSRQTLNNANFTNSTIENCTFTNLRFNNAQFVNATFKNVTFTDCFILDSSFNKATFDKVAFEGRISASNLNIGGTQITNSNLVYVGDNSDFSGSSISETVIKIEYCNSINFSNVLIRNNSHISISYPDRPVENRNYIFTNAQIINSKISNTSFIHTSFYESNLSNTEIIDCKFVQCDFNRAILYGIELSNETVFNSPNFKNSFIDRYALECIPVEQIPKSYRVKMNCKDDVAELRLMYSGIYGYTNLVLLFLFLTPYCWFIAKLWTVARFTSLDDTQTISMIGALGRFITSGGTSWETNWVFKILPISIFTISLLYNICRFTLLAKTVSLEHSEKIRSLPVKFNITTQPWYFIYRLNKILFSINAVAVLLHTIHFMLQRVPIGIG